MADQAFVRLSGRPPQNVFSEPSEIALTLIAMMNGIDAFWSIVGGQVMKMLGMSKEDRFPRSRKLSKETLRRAYPDCGR